MSGGGLKSHKFEAQIQISRDSLNFEIGRFLKSNIPQSRIYAHASSADLVYVENIGGKLKGEVYLKKDILHNGSHFQDLLFVIF